MESVSPFSAEIYEEWKQLVFPEGSLETKAKESRAAALDSRCFVDGTWRVSIDDASLVTSLRTTLALQAGRFREAVALGERYLAHPEIENADSVFVFEEKSRLGIARILAGDVDRGVGTLDELLDQGRLHMRTHLHPMFLDLGPETSADPRVREFMVRLFQRWPEHADKAEPARNATTNEDLLVLLEETWERPPVRRRE
jgi:hypothetical protein